VPQTSGDKPVGLAEWIGDGSESIDNTDVVLWHTFGVTHFPSPEDFPVMPAEPMTLLLRPRNFFAGNPVMDVPPSYASTPSQLLRGEGGVRGVVDAVSRLAFSDAGENVNGDGNANGNGAGCCRG
jgi:primary-amine oxidase